MMEVRKEIRLLFSLNDTQTIQIALRVIERLHQLFQVRFSLLCMDLDQSIPVRRRQAGHASVRLHPEMGQQVLVGVKGFRQRVPQFVQIRILWKREKIGNIVSRSLHIFPPVQIDSQLRHGDRGFIPSIAHCASLLPCCAC